MNNDHGMTACDSCPYPTSKACETCSVKEPNKIRRQPSREWLMRMAEEEDKYESISVGGLYVDIKKMRERLEHFEEMRDALGEIYRILNSETYVSCFVGKKIVNEIYEKVKNL